MPRLQIDWKESVAELHERYLAESNPHRRSRLHAFWLLRREFSIRQTADVLGYSYPAVQKWTVWYRQKGLEYALERTPGHGATPPPGYLTREQIDKVREQAKTGAFRVATDAADWIWQQFGVEYTQAGIYSLFERENIVHKRPRPRHEKADVEAQEAWKKGASDTRSPKPAWGWEPG